MKTFAPAPRPAMAHQRTAFERFKDAAEIPLWWEQRCGKTRVMLDIAAYRYACGDIDALVDIAWPNGVHRVLVDEAPKDLPPDLPWRAVVWRSGKMASKSASTALAELLTYDGLAVLTLNCEALLTATAWGYLRHFFDKRRVFVVADEASWAASPSAGRTKRLLAIGRHRNSVVRAILDGTPVAESPLDIYAPTQFLRPGILGFSSFFAMRNRYAMLEEGYAPGGRTFKHIVGYRNLPELAERMARIGSRLLRSELTDAPAKQYLTRYFAMSPRQRAVYDLLRESYVAELRGGQRAVADALTRLLRLQMIARGYFPPERFGAVCTACAGEGCAVCDDIGYVVEVSALERIDPDHAPAQEAFGNELATTREPVLVWCRFRQDVADAIEVARAVGRNPVRYDGTVSEADRETAYHGFRTGDYDTIVGTLGSGLSRGKDLQRATKVVFYSNSYSLRSRQQAEDRAEALARTVPTAIVDLVAEDTGDLAIIAALREKRSLSDLVLGDDPKEWL